MEVGFSQTIYGDFSLVGNGVLGCPPDEEDRWRHPPDLCRQARHRQGNGVSDQNNGHHVTWVDVDSAEETYNSSSATFTLPAGATVAYAKLSWAATTGVPSTTPCGRSSRRPPGSPEGQVVSLAVGERAAVSLGSPRFAMTVDPLDSLKPTDEQFYSARAEVTEELRGIATGAPIAVTVGNIWTPEGPDCFAGWSLLLVWQFDGPNAQYAPTRNHVIVYDEHLRMRAGTSHLPVRIDALRASGGATRLGVVAYDGDWAVSGDQLLVNGMVQADPAGGGSGNFFSSYAEGSRTPDAINNMSVDAKTVSLPDTVIRATDTTARLTFTSHADAYLVQTIAVSLPLPELTATMSVDRPVAHAGDPVRQTVHVSNVGQATAHSIMVRVDGNPACAHNIDRLLGGTAATVTCTDVAHPDDYRTTALINGSSLAGDTLTANASSSVEVIRPALEVTQRVDSAVVLSGQTVNVQVEARNTGDTPLSDVALDHTQLDICDRRHPTPVKPGQSIVINCAVTADDDVTNTVVVSGTDKLSKRTATTTATDFTVIHPRLVLSAVWSADTAPKGEQVTITVSLSNPNQITVTDIQAKGEPTECLRTIGTLHPGQALTYTCSVTVTQDMTTELSATGTPLINHQTIHGNSSLARTTATAPVDIQLALETQAAAPPLTEPDQPQQIQPEPPTVHAATQAKPLNKPTFTIITIAAAIVCMLIVSTAISATRKR